MWILLHFSLYLLSGFRIGREDSNFPGSFTVDLMQGQYNDAIEVPVSTEVGDVAEEKSPREQILKIESRAWWKTIVTFPAK